MGKWLTLRIARHSVVLLCTIAKRIEIFMSPYFKYHRQARRLSSIKFVDTMRQRCAAFVKANGALHSQVKRVRALVLPTTCQSVCSNSLASLLFWYRIDAALFSKKVFVVGVVVVCFLFAKSLVVNIYITSHGCRDHSPSGHWYYLSSCW